MIQNIEIGKITPHLNNLRKDLGDLTELIESIKTNGTSELYYREETEDDK